MQTPSVGKLIAIALSLLLGVAALVARSRVALPASGDAAFKPTKKKRKLLFP